MEKTKKDKDFEFKNNNWKRVLHEIYKHAPVIYSYGVYGQITEEHPLIKKLKLSPNEIEDNLEFLRQQELINTKSGNCILTREGFNVALENEKQNKELEVNYIITIFTAVLTFGVLADLMRLIKEGFITPSYFLILIVFIILLVFIYNRLHKN